MFHSIARNRKADAFLTVSDWKIRAQFFTDRQTANIIIETEFLHLERVIFRRDVSLITLGGETETMAVRVNIKVSREKPTD